MNCFIKNGARKIAFGWPDGRQGDEFFGIAFVDYGGYIFAHKLQLSSDEYNHSAGITMGASQGSINSHTRSVLDIGACLH